MPEDANRVAETATTTGTGTLTLAGAVLGHQTFGTAYGTGGNTDVYYGIVHADNGSWEVGIGTFLGATNQLQRDLVIGSSAGGSNVSFASGNKTVYVPQPAEMTKVIRCRRSTDVGLELRPASGQTADLIEAYSTGGSKTTSLTHAGALSTGSVTTTSNLAVGGNANITGSVALGTSGTAADPSISFTGDTDTGIYRNGADTLSFSTAGTARLHVGAAGNITSTGGQFLGVGTTATTPAFSFSGDTNTGIYSSGADTISISTAGAEGFKIGSTGTVLFPLVGTTASAANAFLSAGTGQLLRSTSSLRYKKDVTDLDADHAVAVIAASRPITYKSKSEADDHAATFFGLIAEEVAEIDSRLVHYVEEEGTEIPDGVQYERYIPLLISVVKEQQQRIASLEEALSELTARVAALEAN